MILSKSSYNELKASFEANESYLVKPDSINRLYLTNSMRLRIPGYRVHYLRLVMDYFSRYLLTLKLYPVMTADVLINSLENALEEAMKFSSLDLGHIITLVTEKGPAVEDKKITKYIEVSPFYHVRERSHCPQVQGMIARLICTVKEEEISLNEYSDPLDAKNKLELFRHEYNRVRPHQALKYKVPYEVYTGHR
jgi:putative transposase